MPLIQTKGSASSQAYGQFARQGPAANYIEDVFSTWLYTGTAATQNIVNGIDFLGKGGMVWIKARNATTYNNNMVWATDVNGGFRYLQTNLTAAWTTDGNGAGVLDATGRKSNGFQLASTNAAANASTVPYVSWSFRKQAKFFDVVTWTGNGTLQNISHNLGSVPGCIIVKRTDAVNDWCVYHRSLLNSQMLSLNLTDSVTTTAAWNNTTPTSTQFTVGANTLTNANGGTYVAYLFAHDAGGFGAAGTDSVIKCGTYTGNGSASGPSINLGWEPQWILIKRASSGLNNWGIFDSMRGIVTGGVETVLVANQAWSESTYGFYNLLDLTATGFNIVTSDSEVNFNGDSYVYMAIRRGPMRTPTSGTSVFTPIAYTGNDVYPRNFSTPFSPDAFWLAARTSGSDRNLWSRLNNLSVEPNSLNSASGAYGTSIGVQDAVQIQLLRNNSSFSYIIEAFKRAPGFFDVVNFTGNSVNVTHQLGVTPELIITKPTNLTNRWYIFPFSQSVAQTISGTLYWWAGPYGMGQFTTAAFNQTNYITLQDSLKTTQFFFGDGAISSSAINIGFLFASCPGVSKVGAYTGTGTTQQINCGFTGGARFILIKRVDSTGDWYLWDTARGISAGNDPFLLFNSNVSENTSTDYVDAYSAGFEISSTAPTAINGSGGTFIYLAIA